jgi:hypothetical protein
MIDDPKIISFAQWLENRQREQGEPFGRMDLVSAMIGVSAEAVHKMRDLGASRDDIARHFRFVASELDRGEPDL